MRETEKQAALERTAAIERRAQAIRYLQESLRNGGYSITVAVSSSKADQIELTSKDFGDTDHRVRFLSFLRGRNSPVFSACHEGYRTARLIESSFGFSEEYSLECFKW